MRNHRAPHSPERPPSFADAAPLPDVDVAPTAAAAALLRSSAADPLPLVLTLLLSPAVTACMEGLGPNPGAGSMAGLAAKPALAAAGAPDCDWWKKAAVSYGCMTE